MGFALPPRIGGGIDQHLEGGHCLAGLLAGLADHGGDRAARRVAADGEACGIGAEGWSVVADVPEGGERIVGRGGEGMLGRQAIVDRNNLAAALVGQPPAGRIVRLDVADHEAAAVIVDQGGQRAGRDAERTIAATADRAAGTGEAAVDRLGDLGRRRLAVLRHLVDRLAPDGMGQGLEPRAAVLDGLAHQVEQQAGF